VKSAGVRTAIKVGEMYSAARGQRAGSPLAAAALPGMGRAAAEALPSSPSSPLLQAVGSASELFYVPNLLETFKSNDQP